MWKVLVAVIGLSACGGSSPEVVKPDGPVTPELPGLPKAEGKNGVVFSVDGRPLELRVLATGESIEVTDGTPLKLVGEQSGEGFGRAEAEVDIGGKVGILPNNAVLVGERMRISPVSPVGLFIATRECSPKCVSDVWALHPDGRRLNVTEGASDPSFAFAPNGQQIAIGGDGLWLLTVKTWKVLKYKEFTAPAYSHDNVLYVRTYGELDTLMQLYSGGQAAEIASEPGTPSGPMPLPVTFENGGKTIVVVFSRAGGDKTTRVPR